MDKIIEYEKQLPSTIEELIDFVIVTNEAIKSFKIKLNACDKAELVKGARDQVLNDGRKISRLHLEAESRLGELLSELPKPKFDKQINGSLRGTTDTLPKGINKKESHYAQEIYRHPELVNRVFMGKLNDIPTRHDVIKAIKEIKRNAKIEVQKEEIIQGLEKPEGLYDIIVIDPPWKYDKSEYDADARRVASQYPSMELTEIINIDLPIKKEGILWFWATQKFIWDAKEILETWGFEYISILIWDKEKMGIGRWLRNQCEFCLLGIKGKPLWEAKDIRDIIREPRTKHSVKPECFYEMIDNNFIGRKLDYFGRKKRKDWDIYGAGQNNIQ